MAKSNVRLAFLAFVAASFALCTVSYAAPGCVDNTPVDQQSCSLDLAPGTEAVFKCANPSPPLFPKKIYNWSGEVVDVAQIFGANTSITQVKDEYKIKVAATALTAAGGITCTQMAPSSYKNKAGIPNKEEAKKIAVNSLIIRVGGGPDYTQDDFALKSAGSAIQASNLPMVSLLGIMAHVLFN